MWGWRGSLRRRADDPRRRRCVPDCVRRVGRRAVREERDGGVASGGTIVTLRGLGFDVGPVAYCRFGESKAQISSVISVDAEKLVCATPPAPRKVLHGDGTAEDVHLLLSTDNVVYIDIGYDYTYYDQPTAFSQVVPAGGPKRGGTAVANFETVAEAIPASKIIKQAVDTYGKLDGVVNNAQLAARREVDIQADPRRHDLGAVDHGGTTVAIAQ